MSIAFASCCCFPPTISSVSSGRLLSASPFTCFASDHNRRNPSNRVADRIVPDVIEGVSQKKSPGRAKDYADGNSVKPKPFGAQRKEKRKKSIQFDLNDQQVGAASLQNAALLNAVVKVYCTHTAPDYSLPWQKQRQFTSTGSAFMIGDGKLLTNAHCVEHYTQVKVKRRGDDTKYVAKVLAKGVDCDIALLAVESEDFWEDAEPLQLGHLPHLQDAVTVVGYPLGGDTISVTKGVVSRIEVTSYAHGSSELLGIQIDAAINPGNSGGPAFNDHGECIGVAFQVYRSEEAENIGYVIPTTVVSHFLNDYERNQKYTGFPSLGVLLQKLENPALRECLKVPSSEGVLVRRVEPTSDANRVLKEGDVIVSFDNIRVGCEGTVPFRSNERIAFRYLISQKSAFLLDNCWFGVYSSHRTTYRLKLLTKARYSLAKFKEEQIVILSQVLANEVNIGYEDMGNQQVLKFNGTRIRNIHHLAHLIDTCKGKYLAFEFEDNYLVVLEKEPALGASSQVLLDYGIPSERSSDLLQPYVDSNVENNQPVANGDFGDSPVTNLEIGVDGILWA
ncbi:Protease Do-like 2, chloroplastic [Linum grandiflorum]